MNIPTKKVLISFLAIFIAAGILLFPSPGKAAITRSPGVHYIKIIVEPVIYPYMQFGEPGEDPGLSTVFLGSRVAASIDQQQIDLPKDAGTESGATKPRFIKWLFNYLNKFTSNPILGR